MNRHHNDNWRRCGDCAAWDGGDDEIGECSWQRRDVGRQERACLDFYRMPTPEQLRSLR